MQVRSQRLARENSVRQDTILVEAIHRVRRHANLREDELHNRPIVIVVTKWDSWKELLPDLSQEAPILPNKSTKTLVLDGERIESTSEKVGNMLREFTPEIVAAAQGFAKKVTFIPVSATGISPKIDTTTGTFGIRPRDVAPYWVEVPMLYALSNSCRGIIGTQSRSKARQKTGAPT